MFMRIEDYLKNYCEERSFRLTIQDNKLHLVYVVEDVTGQANIRTASFDDVSEMINFVRIRN